MVWQYFEALRRAVQRSHNEHDGTYQRQDVAVAVFLAVTTVETFLNLYFTVLVGTPQYGDHRARIERDLRPPFASLDRKWKEWPLLLFGRAIEVTEGPGKAFMDLKTLRNRLMHFTSSNDTVELPGTIVIVGLPDTSVLDSLTPDDASKALRVAEQAIAAVFRAMGVTESRIPHELHLWTGTVPT